MCTRFFRPLILGGLVSLGLPVAALAQAPPNPAGVPQTPTEAVSGLTPYKSACGNTLSAPLAQPPDGSVPTLVALELCFGKQGGTPILEADTYLYYIRANAVMSAPSQGRWVPFTDATVQTIREDFQRLWQQGFLDDLSIEVNDYIFPNGAVGKVLSYHMEERERVKTVRYDGTKQIDRTKIEEQLRELGVTIGVDSFLDAAKIRRVETILREMMLEKGFNPEVTHKIEPIQASSSATPTKTVNLTFLINEGPRVKIKRVDFTGNRAFEDGLLAKQLKENKPSSFLSTLTGTGTYNQAKFEEDAERVMDYYQNRGYPNVRVGQPEVRVLTDSKNGKTRWVELRVPVTEGALYNFGTLDFDGNQRVPSQYLHSLYDVRPGEIYNRKKILEGNRRAQETYGALGFMEFNPFPDLSRSDQGADPEAALAALVPEALLPVEPVDEPKVQSAETPTVDVTIRITEGEQFFINRIVFTGNTTTRDNVVRRELGTLLEGAPFNSEALKVSVRRINQLGYFKPLEGNDKDMKVDKTPGKTNMVDVTVKLEEQNRNQLTFGAGVSQYEGFFGQLAFSTSNFLGRGESLTLSLQGGQRARNYQLGFTEPFLFDRNITGGVDLHKRQLRYEGYYTQDSTGGSLVLGMPLRAFTRFFVKYSYEAVSISELNEALLDPSCLASVAGCSIIDSLTDLSQLTSAQQQNLCSNPFACDALLLGTGGKRTISKVTPSLLHNTVDHPIFPTTGTKYTTSVDVAAFGGNTQYLKPHVEGIWFFRQSNRTSIGLRAQFEYITPLRETRELPVFERLFLGGEYSIRGFDIRSIGPTVPGSLVVLGGNKSLLFNAEYLINIAGPVRLVLFYDAGQVRDVGEKFVWKEDLTTLVYPTPPPVVGLLPEIVQPLDALGVETKVVGQASAFKTSTGVEVRFFMPVLNVPFRLIYAWNPQRAGVLDNSFEPTKASVFRFAVGTTF